MASKSRSTRGEEWVDSTGAVVRADRRRPQLTPSETEKRTFERLAISRKARVTEVDQFGTPGSEVACSATNISRGGMGLCLPRMIHLNRGVLIEVFGGANEPPRLFYGLVRQCRYIEGQGYIVGIQFEVMPKTTALEMWRNDRKSRPATE